MGFTGASLTHGNNFRSFDVTCSVYNIDNKEQQDFVIYCFFDNNRRWKNYTLPSQGALVHVVGRLVGSSNLSSNDFCPALIITGYKSLSGVVSTSSTPSLSPLSAKSTSKLAPPGYTKPSTTVRAPTTPSHAQKVLSGKATKKRKVVDDESEDESFQTLPTTPVAGVDSIELPNVPPNISFSISESDEAGSVQFPKVKSNISFPV